MRIDVYTWQDAYVSTIGPEELLSLTHTDELNGEDSVDIVTTFALKQGYRLVWVDRLGKVHEHVCQDPKGLHAGGLHGHGDQLNLRDVRRLYRGQAPLRLRLLAGAECLPWADPLDRRNGRPDRHRRQGPDLLPHLGARGAPVNLEMRR